MGRECYKVLVAEDEVLLLESIVEKVEELDLGFHVVATAHNGRRAMQLVEEHLPDVLLTDIRMPLVDGLELLQWVHKHYKHIQKIVLSGYSDFDYAKQAIRCNVVDYLLKPVSKQDLQGALLSVRALLDRQGNTPAQGDHNATDMQPEEVVEYLFLYIQEHFRENIDLTAQIEQFHYSQDYISRLFVKRYGESPSKYQTSLRMNEAKHLLRGHEELSVRQVAERIGYDDQSYFSRIFKKHTGTTPLLYRSDSQ